MSDADDVILEFLVPRLQQLRDHRSVSTSPSARSHTIIVAISGCQGSGKSTVASSLVFKLSSIHGYRTAEISLDDFYLTRAGQEQLSHEKPQNNLLRTRGQPGTHELQLAEAFFRQFEDGNEDSETALFWPSFDKSLFGGRGDRAAVEHWKKVERHPPLDVIIFEGWSVGFQPLGHARVKEKWSKAQGTNQRLASTRLEDLLLLDEELKKYCNGFMTTSKLDFMILLDPPTLETVYLWREEQEQKLRQRMNGSGMTEKEVVEFVDGYMPAYEMYLDGLRGGFFGENVDPNRELHLKLDLNRLVLIQ